MGPKKRRSDLMLEYINDFLEDREKALTFPM